MALGHKRQAFVDYYLANGFNATKGSSGGGVCCAASGRFQTVVVC